jgi:hypothetical protein
VVLHILLLTIFLRLLTAKQYCHEEVADKIGLEWLTGVATFVAQLFAEFYHAFFASLIHTWLTSCSHFVAKYCFAVTYE